MRDNDDRVAEPLGEQSESVARSGGEGQNISPEIAHQLQIRLASGAQAAQIAKWVALSLPQQQRQSARVWLQQTARLGQDFLKNYDKAIRSAATSTLSGDMLVSNNPEGLTDGGKILSVNALEGKLDAYVHHSNHTKTPFNMYAVFRPKDEARVGVTGFGSAHAGDVDANRKTDPDYQVSQDMLSAQSNPNAAKAVQLQQPGVQTLHLGQLPGKRGEGHPIFDAKYELELDATAEIDIVAVAGQPSAKAAATTSKVAKGNTAYQMKTPNGTTATNGRAAGIYRGADYNSDKTVAVSKLPFKHQVTAGHTNVTGQNKVESPMLKQAGESVAIDKAKIASLVALANKDEAVAEILDQVLRISKTWLAESGTWNPTQKKFDLQVEEKDSNKNNKVDQAEDKNRDGKLAAFDRLPAPYMTLIRALQAAVKKDAGDPKAEATIAVIKDRMDDLAANGDFASYGTMFHLSYFVHNDTDAAAQLNMIMHSDVNAKLDDDNKDTKGNPQPSGMPFRGRIAVDGVQRDIFSDSQPLDSNGKPGPRKDPTHDIGSLSVPKNAGKYVQIEYMSPGQITAGQAFEFTGKGGKPVPQNVAPSSEPKAPQSEPTSQVDSSEADTETEQE